MLDINFVRANLELVKRKLDERGFPAEAIARFGELDERRRRLIGLRDDLNASRNRESQEIGQLMKSGQKDQAESRRQAVRELGDRIATTGEELAAVEEDLSGLMTSLPNLQNDSVPVGADESANQEIKRWGLPPEFGFEPLDHVDLATSLGILDLERASKISGARFAVLTGSGARLERALINFCLDLQTKRHGYTEVVPPFIVNAGALFGTGQLPKFEDDLFKLADERNLYLIPTAEVPLTNIHAGEILDGEQLPIKMTAYTPCFRSEAGSYGKDTRGLIRQHQFDKVELVKITRPEDSYEELEKLTRDAEAVLEALGLAYRRVALSTGDLGFSAAKTYDIEVWLPSQNTYREISSCSNCEAFQARRAQIRFRRESKAKPEFAHTLNGSGLAIGRTWLALIENYQQKDGSVIIPEALRPFMDGLQKIERKG
ncbi:MAG TPA: serine--tRNA ligase [Blastocatellia bacterium]|jgi:seryl-tRNA synthetase|nr:serine--tRNA ligase [Blastocatellia bacterium]